LCWIKIYVGIVTSSIGIRYLCKKKSSAAVLTITNVISLLTRDYVGFNGIFYFIFKFNMLALALKMKRVKERNNDKERSVYILYRCLSRKREKISSEKYHRTTYSECVFFMNRNLSPGQWIMSLSYIIIRVFLIQHVVLLFVPWSRVGHIRQWVIYESKYIMLKLYLPIYNMYRFAKISF